MKIAKINGCLSYDATEEGNIPKTVTKLSLKIASPFQQELVIILDLLKRFIVCMCFANFIPTCK